MEIKDNDVYYIDAREGFKFLKSNSVDLILTDPVYNYEGLITYKILSDNARRVLKSSGVMIAEVGRGFFLPHIFPLLDSSGLFFNGILLHFLDSKRFFNKQGLKDSFFLSLLYFKNRDYIFDYDLVYSVKGKSSLNKNFYHWQKDIDMYEYYIKCFTNEGDLVLDPFCGSGSVLLACKRLNRRYIGFDFNKDAFLITKSRLSQHL